MKITLISHLLILTFLTSYGQKYGDIWHFGKGAGIDFNFCTPIALTNGSIPGYEGCSSFSDTTGQLLFYTNSDSVWNKLNNVMPNGFLVNSMGTLSQVIIIPKPLSNSLYYIVTTKMQASGPLTLQYHVVDMNLNGGLGDVVSKNNILFTSNITEQIAATFHNNGTDIWLMAHEYGTNNFLAYLVTASSISLTPVISSIGPAQIPCNSNTNARGEIKFSPDGNKIAFNGNGVGDPGYDSSNILALFDFNNNTGIVSNPINLPYERGDYGLTFSPDNSKLYGTTWKALNFGLSDFNTLYQFDLSSGNPITIANSKQIIYTFQVSSPYGSFGDIKLGPDGKIYVARHLTQQGGSDSLGVINTPNQAGVTCNYVHNGFYLGGKTAYYGLNNYIEYKNYCGSTGVQESHSLPISISIYPNPAQQSFNIELPQQQNFNLLVYDVTGRKVYTNKNATGIVKVDCSNFSSGIYFVQAVNQVTILSSKLIKQ